ncbi:MULTISPECIES: hypothetical protein [Mesorhizobium]|uniref:hypothetical protein n=1 Tax=Mesorhizobium TaxID=68287 RepID=UPI001576662D|nr:MULTISPECIES: hypothetical protein [Mesorhizobium]
MAASPETALRRIFKDNKTAYSNGSPHIACLFKWAALAAGRVRDLPWPFDASATSNPAPEKGRLRKLSRGDAAQSMRSTSGGLFRSEFLRTGRGQLGLDAARQQALQIAQENPCLAIARLASLGSVLSLTTAVHFHNPARTDWHCPLHDNVGDATKPVGPIALVLSVSFIGTPFAPHLGVNDVRAAKVERFFLCLGYAQTTRCRKGRGQ